MLWNSAVPTPLIVLGVLIALGLVGAGIYSARQKEWGLTFSCVLFGVLVLTLPWVVDHAQFMTAGK